MNAEQIRNSWDDDHDVTQTCAFPEPLAEVLTRENRELRRWKSEATEVILGLQDLGKALGLPLGTSITGEAAAEAARDLCAIAADATTAAQNLRDELQGAQERLRAVEALADGWEERGKHDIAYAETIADEDMAEAVRDSGAEWTDFARKVRAALASATPPAALDAEP